MVTEHWFVVLGVGGRDHRTLVCVIGGRGITEHWAMFFGVGGLQNTGLCYWG